MFSLTQEWWRPTDPGSVTELRGGLLAVAGRASTSIRSLGKQEEQHNPPLHRPPLPAPLWTDHFPPTLSYPALTRLGQSRQDFQEHRGQNKKRNTACYLRSQSLQEVHRALSLSLLTYFVLSGSKRAHPGADGVPFLPSGKEVDHLKVLAIR